MKIYITGANGYVGAKIYQYLEKQPEYQVSGGFLGPNENPKLEPLDITDPEQTLSLIEKAQPDAVVHAAAVAHGEDSAYAPLLDKVNVQGTKNVVEAAKKVGAKFVFLSSVSALHDMPYGLSKLKGEELVKKSGLKYLIIRPSMIVGLSPNTFVEITNNKILRAVKEKKSLEEDEVWKFHPSWIEQLCEIIHFYLQGKFTDTEPVYPILPEVKTRYEISNDILKQFGLKAAPIRNPRYDDDTLLTTDSLTRNGLPVYKYDYVINKIVEEIRQSVN